MTVIKGIALNPSLGKGPGKPSPAPKTRFKLPGEKDQAAASRQAELAAQVARLELARMNAALIGLMGGMEEDQKAPSLMPFDYTESLLKLVTAQLEARQGQAPAEPVQAAPAPAEPNQSGAATAKDRTTGPLDRRDLDALIEEQAREQGLDPLLVRAVVRAESDFDPRTVSSAGAMGLMQLMPGTASDLGVEDAFDPAENLKGGTRYLKMMLDKYGNNLERALAAYNWGPGNLDRARTGRLPEETRTYIQRVRRFMQEYKGKA